MKSSNSNKAFKRDEAHTALLIKVGKIAAQEAIRSSKALGLSVTNMKKGEVIEEAPDGTIKVLKPKVITEPTVKLKKGMILHAKE